MQTYAKSIVILDYYSTNLIILNIKVYKEKFVLINKIMYNKLIQKKIIIIIM